ncbi:MAG: PAS domain S-box protein, partial [Rhodocyclaceae bacterium]|nr:PAS domain S-box protein [Rhodocyclaceae bacterium]
MQTPSIPPTEDRRLEALRALKLLDTGADARFDRITRIARRLFGVPIALISLVDANRQWFKSRQGLDAPETPRDISFCGHAILGDDIFVVEDALTDPRFADNPLVTGPPHIRFYAGAPLSSADGHRVGTLCIIDRQARFFPADDRQDLRELADWLQDELRQIRVHEAADLFRRQEARLKAILDTVVDAIITIDDRGVIETANPAAERLFGYALAELAGRNVSCLMPAPYRDEHDGYLKRYLDT